MDLPEIRKTQDGIWVIDGDSHLTKWVEECHRLDHDRQIDNLVKYIPEGGVVVDAGAAIGDHTIAYAKKVGVLGTVLAFEPHTKAFECLKMNSIDTPQVKCHQVALSDRKGWVTLEPSYPNAGQSRITENGKIEIQSFPLDDFYIFFKRFDFLKIDIEGFELRALKGAAHLIEKFKPVIWCESNRDTLTANGCTQLELKNYILNLGYEISISGKEDSEQFDMLCIPKKT